MLVRTNPFLRVVPDGAGRKLHVTNVVTNADYLLPNRGMVGLLGRATDWMRRDALESVAVEEYGLPAERAAAVVDSMLENEFLIGPDGETAALADRAADYRDDGWGPAFEYLLAIRDYPYYRSHDYDSAMERVSERAERAAVPPVYKSYEDRPTVSLPPVEDAGRLPSVRAVLGDGDPGPAGATSDPGGMDAAGLSAVLYYTFGETGSQELAGVGEFVLKTSPSGGGRHPVEAYVGVRDVAGIEAGLYHYAVEHHALERLGGLDDLATLVATLDVPAEDPPAAVLVCTAVVARNMWKYRDPRAYRIPYHDLGHLAETCRVVCEAIGASAAFGATDQGESLSELLGVEPLAEPPLAHAVLDHAK